MWPFDNHSKLLRALAKLAFYNDKGIDYSRHTSEQVESERIARLARIRELVATVGPDSLPSEFLQAVESGDIASDLTGRYIDLVKAHWANRCAP